MTRRCIINAFALSLALWSLIGVAGWGVWDHWKTEWRIER